MEWAWKLIRVGRGQISNDRRSISNDVSFSSREGKSLGDDREMEYREALGCWRRWNALYETATQRMFELRHDPEELDFLADLMTSLRQEALARTSALLEMPEKDRRRQPA